MQSTPIFARVFLQLLPTPKSQEQWPTEFLASSRQQSAFKNPPNRDFHLSILGALLLMEEIWLTTWDVKNLMKNGIFTISAGAGFLPSTVSRVTLIAMKIWWSKHYNYILTSPPCFPPTFHLQISTFAFFSQETSMGFIRQIISFKTWPISPSHTVSMILPAINAPTANMPAAWWRVFLVPTGPVT